MNRSLTAHDIIQLPALSAPETLTLIAAFDAALAGAQRDADRADRRAKGRKRSRDEAAVPDHLVRAFGRLVAERDALAAALEAAAAPRTEAAADEHRGARRDLAAAWSLFEHWLRPWTELADDGVPSRDDVRKHYDAVFGDAGLAFTQEPTATLWAESQRRLVLSNKKKFVALVEALGGARFLRNVVREHNAFGQAVHGDAPRPKAVPPADLPQQLRATLDVLREYVTKVVAYPDPDVAGSAELAARLLAPWTTWPTSETSGAEPAPESSAPVLTPAQPARPRKTRGR